MEGRNHLLTIISVIRDKKRITEIGLLSLASRLWHFRDWVTIAVRHVGYMKFFSQQVQNIKTDKNKKKNKKQEK